MHPNFNEVSVSKYSMDDTLNSDLVKIKWNLMYGKPKAGQNVYMGGMVIAKSEALNVLITSIRSDLRWDDHVFNVSEEAAKCLGFLKRCKKYFTPSDLRTIHVTYISPKMEYN